MTGIAPARLLATLAILAAIALLAVGLIQLADSPPSSSSSTGSQAPLTLAQVQARLQGSPAPLAALHAQAGQILLGGAPAWRARLGALRGYPLVVNKWASWCVPCRSERAAFQRASISFGRSVAFMGIDSGDTSLAGARAFLRALPGGYPSYYDQSGHLGAQVADSFFTPVTVFYDRADHQYIHQGPYPSAARLERDVRRYALDSQT